MQVGTYSRGHLTEALVVLMVSRNVQNMKKRNPSSIHDNFYVLPNEQNKLSWFFLFFILLFCGFYFLIFLLCFALLQFLSGDIKISIKWLADLQRYVNYFKHYLIMPFIKLINNLLICHNITQHKKATLILVRINSQTSFQT